MHHHARCFHCHAPVVVPSFHREGQPLPSGVTIMWRQPLPPPLPGVRTSPRPPNTTTPSCPTDDQTPRTPTVSMTSVCPFDIVLGIPIAAIIVLLSLAHCCRGAQVQHWGGAGSWRWSAARPRTMLTTTILCCCCPSLSFLYLCAITFHLPFWLLKAPTTGSLWALFVSCCWPSPLSCRWLVVVSMPTSSSFIRSVVHCSISSSPAIVQASMRSLLATAQRRGHHQRAMDEIHALG